MIKEMRYKFILVTFSALLLIVILILGTIYISVAYSNESNMNKKMEKVLGNDGRTLRNWTKNINSHAFSNSREEFLNSTFAVRLDESKRILEIIGYQEEDYPDVSIQELADKALQIKKEKGSIGDLKFLSGKKAYGYMLVFSDYSEQNSMLDNLFHTCLFMGIAGSLLIGLFIIRLSYWVVGPVDRAFKMQKNFISNASHELKTPLTVISANAELLENSNANRKWVRTIKENTERMNALVNDLLSLSRMEDKAKIKEFQTFNLSKVVVNAVLTMDSVAYEQQKELSTGITENIFYYGEQDKIKELVIILLDNAIKYSDEKGRVKVSLYEKNKRAVLEVFNTGPIIPKEEGDKIFERFYRGNTNAENITDGFGLGLPIAKAITVMHKGKIGFENIKGAGVKFVVKL
ncbi:MAG TPA: HAMP domain-containing histidine kinase [Clostridiales bacterium]|nr:HAMP domain-containing histidine kinase [Clostridiales bacterium]